MAQMTGRQYLESMEKMKTKVYLKGNLVADMMNHPDLSPTYRALALSYNLANEPVSESLYTSRSHFNGRKINGFTRVYLEPEDLVSRIQQVRDLTLKHGGCVGARCTGIDAINAVYAVTYDLDMQLGTDYHRRVQSWLMYIHEQDLAVSGMSSHPILNNSPGADKRSGRIGLRVVKEVPRGIIVRGAIVHRAASWTAHEYLVLPGNVFSPEDRIYALAFAVPADEEGICHILSSKTYPARKVHDDAEIGRGNYRYGNYDGLVIFDEVFVPWERVFMYGETEYAGSISGLFNNYRQMACCGCKSGYCDLLLGSLQLFLENSDLKKVEEIQEKMTDIVFNSELSYGCAIGAAQLGARTSSGVFRPDVCLVNAARLQASRAVYAGSRLAYDFVGGVTVAVPNEEDLRNPEIGAHVDELIAGIKGMNTGNRMRIIQLIEDLSAQTSFTPVEAVIEGGTADTRRASIWAELCRRSGRLSALAREIAGIKEG